MDDRSKATESLESIQQLIQWRSPKIRQAKQMGAVVNQLIARRGYLQSMAAQRIQDCWRRAAGAHLAAATHPGNIRRGVLDVFAANSSVMQELSFAKRRILRQIQSSDPDLKIRDLRLKLGTFESNSHERPADPE